MEYCKEKGICTYNFDYDETTFDAEYMKTHLIKKEVTMLFIHYPKCTTCQKAKKWLDENNIDYTERHIVENNPSYDELKQWHEKGGLELKKFFNTSGRLYKEMQLKDKLPAMSEEEQLRLLSTNGMLVKRPIVVCNDTVLVGFREAQWAEQLK